MFDRLLAAITDLPVIIQGALGSALFALVMYFGQRVAARLQEQWSSHSRSRRHTYLIEQKVKLGIFVAQDNAEMVACISLLAYRALRAVVKAMIWLVLGLLGGSFMTVLGAAGFLGAACYLFSALATLSPPKKQGDDYKAKWERANEELKRFESEA
jgi:hypothetical protein